MTIVALSRQSAHSGLPKVRLRESNGNALTICMVDDNVLLSATPTLCQQFANSNWGERAWTFQEGLLSPRCLYSPTIECTLSAMRFNVVSHCRSISPIISKLARRLAVSGLWHESFSQHCSRRSHLGMKSNEQYCFSWSSKTRRTVNTVCLL